MKGHQKWLLHSKNYFGFILLNSTVCAHAAGKKVEKYISKSIQNRSQHNQMIVTYSGFLECISWDFSNRLSNDQYEKKGKLTILKMPLLSF